jgi:hypothetical protein
MAIHWKALEGHLLMVLTVSGFIHPLWTYSAFHSRSPSRAVTGPVEIHAFSTWNSKSVAVFNQSNQ